MTDHELELSADIIFRFEDDIPCPENFVYEGVILRGLSDDPHIVNTGDLPADWATVSHQAMTSRASFALGASLHDLCEEPTGWYVLWENQLLPDIRRRNPAYEVPEGKTAYIGAARLDTHLGQVLRYIAPATRVVKNRALNVLDVTQGEITTAFEPDTVDRVFWNAGLASWTVFSFDLELVQARLLAALRRDAVRLCLSAHLLARQVGADDLAWTTLEEQGIRSPQS